MFRNSHLHHSTFTSLPFFLALAAIPAGGQSPTPSTPTLDVVVVTSTPLGRTLFDQAQPVSVLTGEPLRLQLQPTLGETLATMPGVSSSYFGPGSSRPVIRGLEADRVRVLQNGVNTIDASATSVDHAVSFDPVGVQSIEVVRGPATLLYGAHGRFGARLEGVYAARQNRVSDFELPTDSYFMINANVSYRLGTGPVTWDAYVRGVNLTNEEARLHTSFLKDIAPLGGAGVQVGLKAVF